ncbi:MAG: hypothetical protein RJA70_3868 [Pseudomonadota bacterium]|jgi:hypothetical protein
MAAQDKRDEKGAIERTASSPWTDLGLTLPIFLIYHLGVVNLEVRNAADLVTRELLLLAEFNQGIYWGLTLGGTAAFVGLLTVAGRGHALRWQAFAGLMAESVVYAVAMRFAAAYVVGRVSLGAGGGAGPLQGLIMSFGAGFYEELAFRVVLFGFGFKLIRLLFPLAAWQSLLVMVGWGVLTSVVFSLWHYIGPMGDPLEWQSFVFRAVCGMVFVLIYKLRGFAPAVWTHALYDVWVLVF